MQDPILTDEESVILHTHCCVTVSEWKQRDFLGPETMAEEPNLEPGSSSPSIIPKFLKKEPGRLEKLL